MILNSFLPGTNNYQLVVQRSSCVSWSCYLTDRPQYMSFRLTYILLIVATLSHQFHPTSCGNCENQTNISIDLQLSKDILIVNNMLFLNYCELWFIYSVNRV